MNKQRQGMLKPRGAVAKESERQKRQPRQRYPPAQFSVPTDRQSEAQVER
jgi:hypothetical protein